MPDIEKAHVDALKRRARYLAGKLDASSEYNGRLYDSAEYQALEWVLGKAGHPLNAPSYDEPPRRDQVIDGSPAAGRGPRKRWRLYGSN